MSSREDARLRNEQLLSQMESSGALHSPAVADAFRSVLRHHFLPDRPLDEVYEDTAIMTKVGIGGAAVSSSSQPAIMAIMLEQLSPQPGQRVMEIGAGTGYNAALLAHLVGAEGQVVTVDIDDDLCEQARANLLRAGVEGVQVVRFDGALGWLAAAPYDRIVVTASADDLSPSWPDQLVDGGRLVAPLALAGPIQQSIAFVLRDRALFSDGVTSCGFMPMRGKMAPLVPRPDAQLEAWLAEPGQSYGPRLPASDLRSGFETWLALTDNGYVRFYVPGLEATVFGLRDGRGLALVVDGANDHDVNLFGEGEPAAARLFAAHREWSRWRPQVEELRVAAYRAGEEPALAGDERIVQRPNFTFVVSRMPSG